MTANNILTDKNGREMRTGDIVRVDNSYFKNDNGLYFIEHTPGDPSWCGSDYCLKKIGKAGKISTAKYSIAFWPLASFTNDRFKNAAADDHNKKYATIEIISGINTAEVVAYFKQEVENSSAEAQRLRWRFGEDNDTAKKYDILEAFYNSVAAYISGEEATPEEVPTEEEKPAEEPTTAAEEDTPEQITGEPQQMTLDMFVKPNTTTPEAPRPTLYYDISEETARRAWDNVHMSDYKTNSATNEYKASVDEVAQIAEAQKKKVSPFYHAKIDALLDKYSRKLAAWYNDYNRNEASCPSWFISGPANYPVRKHEKKMNREARLWEEYDEIKGIIDRIKSVGTGPIDLSDPNAREMLQDRLKKLQEELENDKALNAYYRKHNSFIGFPGLSDERAEKLTAEFEETKNRCPWIVKPCPDYELTSLRDKIKRTQERIAELDKRDAALEAGEDTTTKFDGGEIIRNIELDRLQIIFDSIPDEETRGKLKNNGFRWSPKNKAWQRQLTPNAERALSYIGL